jgi:hypothetical protein
MKNPLEYIENYPERTKQIIGINYEQWSALVEVAKTEEERLAAAVALYQIGSPIAIYQLRGVGLFDENKKVALVCKNLYYTYHTLHSTEYLVSF